MEHASGARRLRIVELDVTPRARADEVLGWRGGVLVIRVRAAPERGRANEAALALAARALGVERSSLRLVLGATARRKWVAVETSGAPLVIPTSQEDDSSSTGDQPGGSSSRSHHSRHRP